ncbi:hypothetical protein RHGRI_015870 [Rhododendron griersonianum]|uniref:Uncharacterized protein n=1 Tax=Rhododendron griersonianum TaxID=479676 RepID=A0AAV6JNZ6_9ERIC|nr:hypothetical protein RHGRI_015870 [Rhododendron griersonianum]
MKFAHQKVKTEKSIEFMSKHNESNDLDNGDEYDIEAMAVYMKNFKSFFKNQISEHDNNVKKQKQAYRVIKTWGDSESEKGDNNKDKENYMAFVASLNSCEDSESSDNELEEEESIGDLETLKAKYNDLYSKSIKKATSNKEGLGYVEGASSSKVGGKIVFVKPIRSAPNPLEANKSKSTIELQLQEYGTDSKDEYDNFEAEEEEIQEPLAEKLNHALKHRVKEDLELDGQYKVPADLSHNKEGPENAESMETAVEVQDAEDDIFAPNDEFEDEDIDDGIDPAMIGWGMQRNLYMCFSRWERKESDIDQREGVVGISDGFVGGEDRGRRRRKEVVMASGGLDENGGQDR